MRLLLDSHAFLWFVSGDASLSLGARGAIEDGRNEKHVSHATAWELAIKLSLGKLRLAVPYRELFPGALLANGFRELSAIMRNCSHCRSIIATRLTGCFSRKRALRK